MLDLGVSFNGRPTYVLNTLALGLLHNTYVTIQLENRRSVCLTGLTEDVHFQVN